MAATPTTTGGSSRTQIPTLRPAAALPGLRPALPGLRALQTTCRSTTVLAAAAAAAATHAPLALSYPPSSCWPTPQLSLPSRRRTSSSPPHPRQQQQQQQHGAAPNAATATSSSTQRRGRVRAEAAAAAAAPAAAAAAAAPAAAAPVAAAAASSSSPAWMSIFAVVLGYGCLVGSCFRSVPQIAIILRTGSAEGLSLTSNLVELLCFTVSVAYNIQQGYAFNTYGEVFACWIQDVIIVGLIFRHMRLAGTAVAAATAAFAACCAWLFSPWCPMQVLSALQLSTILVMAVGARVPQIWLNLRRGNAGVLSPLTQLLNVAGCVVRIFTTVVLTGDVIILGGCVTQLILNAILLYQSVATPGTELTAAPPAATTTTTTTSSGSESGGGGPEPVVGAAAAAAVAAAIAASDPPTGGVGEASGQPTGGEGLGQGGGGKAGQGGGSGSGRDGGSLPVVPLPAAA